ncbi:hypothetical protein AJ79_02651 [Helicocarpus griseus UAMH5409]|uniref:Murein transglycosylase n=1 Tax=Helicocarpus griseus UAMH5409 TaxID=1447875 RepID=A0A2B7Y1Q5_9EURO|nr:hypothetical protein AJ79_02651 [Helicocarpus griseus UAMH5409]
MKTGIFAITAISLLSAASALPQPYRVQNEKRAAVTNYVAVDVPKILVWVDQNGKPVSTQTKGQVSTYAVPQETAITKPPPKKDPVKKAEPPASPPPKPAVAVGANVGVEINAPKIPFPNPLAPFSGPKPTKEAAPTSAPSSNGISPPTKGLGVCYAPYKGDGGCKSKQEIDDDFSKLDGYNVVRFYGVDCNQVPNIISAAKKHNKQVFAGIFDIKDLDNNLKKFIDGAKSSWSTVATVSIGNELVNGGQASVGDVVNAVNKARSILRGAGYQGPVVTVDTFNALIANPELCKASDYCAANCHAFFDPNTDASRAGEFVKKQAKLVSDAAGKKTVITESGWPKSGQANGKAIPSQENQQLAVQSLKAAFGNDDEAGLFLFSAFDDSWKKDNGGTFGAEKFWGILP